jgi:hypothetical protein
VRGLFVQQSRRHVHSLMHPDQASQVKLASLQPHLQRLSVIICSHLFWPKVPDANIQLELPGAYSKTPSLYAGSCLLVFDLTFKDVANGITV